jgi:flagellar hook assembly protein FlgD
MGVAIGEINWYGPHDFLIGSASVANLDVTSDRKVDDGRVHLSLTGPRPSRSRVELQVDLPVTMQVRLAVFDVTGRRMKTIVDRQLPAGITSTAWDGRDVNGRAVASGIYFARMTCMKGDQVVKAVLLR